MPKGAKHRSTLRTDAPEAPGSLPQPAQPLLDRAPAHLANLVQQLLVGGGRLLAHIVALPVEADAVAVALLDVAVDAVVAHVGLAAVEPGDVDGALVQVKVVPGMREGRQGEAGHPGKHVPWLGCRRHQWRRRQAGSSLSILLTCGSSRRCPTFCSSETARQRRPRSPASKGAPRVGRMSNPTLPVPAARRARTSMQTYLGVLERLRIHVLVLGERVDMGALHHMLRGLVDSGGHVCGSATGWCGYGEPVGGWTAWVLQRSTDGAACLDVGAGRVAGAPDRRSARLEAFVKVLCSQIKAPTHLLLSHQARVGWVALRRATHARPGSEECWLQWKTAIQPVEWCGTSSREAP